METFQQSNYVNEVKYINKTNYHLVLYINPK